MEAHPEPVPGHAPHGPLVFGADEPTVTGSRLPLWRGL